jgi:hypothetical protein
LFNLESNVTLSNSIVANSPGGGDCVTSSTVTADSFNIIEDNSCNTSALAIDPKLSPLMDNGGPTKTHALLAGSGAIDAGDDGICSNAPVNGKDQRGITRPQGAACDIGAYEVEDAGFFVIPIPGGKSAIFGL